MFRIISYNFSIAIEALVQNKTRAFLTSLGIICGVASVIAMLAIGKGAQTAIIDKMKLLGTNNIIIKPINIKDKENNSKNNEEKDKEKKDQAKRFTPGLTLKDAKSIKSVIPNISAVSPEILVETLSMRNGFSKHINLVGITPDYFKINPTIFIAGDNFSKIQMDKSLPICIIGSSTSSKLFALDNPIGKKIKCGKNWLTVVGVLKNKLITKDNIKNLGIRNYNEDIYIPISTMLLRYVNRALVTKNDIGGSTYGVVVIYNNLKKNDNNYHQLDRIIVQVKDNKYIKATAEIIARMLKRRHNNVQDYKISIPELLLQQEQSTRRIFNIVLGAIASISLLVGGIGIMNIMLASVLERTREIGVRRAVGAKQHDILIQFLIEAVTISLSGGIVGVILGIVLSYAITYSTDIVTVVSGLSVFVSFIVSISVGLVFGIAPARKASFEDPILLLRYE